MRLSAHEAGWNERHRLMLKYYDSTVFQKP